MSGGRLVIEVNGKEYPCYMTMGAFLEFRAQTGAEASERLAGGSMTDTITWLWACVRSASRREGDMMPMGLQEFADNIDMDQLAAWQHRMLEAQETAQGDEGKPADSKKKRKIQS